MTDARLPGPWLLRPAWMRLSDRAVRTFAQSLMWSNEAGSDGDLPPDCFHYLHPAGLDDATAEELIAAGWWERTASGYRVPDWTGKAGQESAKAVDNRRAANRRYQAEHRARQAGKQSSPADVSADIRPDVRPSPVGQDRQGQALTESTLVPKSAALEIAKQTGCMDCQRAAAFDQPPCPQHRQDADAA